ELRGVGGDEVAPVAAARVVDVSLVEINAGVVAVGEVLRVGAGAAADVEHAAHPAQVVVAADGRELVFGEGRLPQAVDQPVLHQVREPHSRHLTSNRPQGAECGKRVSRYSRNSGVKRENCGSLRMTATRTSCDSIFAAVDAGVSPLRKSTSGASGPA